MGSSTLVPYPPSSSSDQEQEEQEEEEEVKSYRQDAENEDETCRTRTDGMKRRGVDEEPEPVVKKVKRTLPRLPSSFRVSPQDDPRAHQGRVRSRPWVQGEWAVHVYLDVEIPEGLKRVLDNMVAHVQQQQQQPTIHKIYSDSARPSLHISLSQPLGLRRCQIPLLLAHLRGHARRASSSSSSSPSPKRLIGLNGGLQAFTNGVQETLDASLDASLEDGKSEKRCQAKVEVEGRHGVGVKNRGFLALGVGTGHDQLEKLTRHVLDPFLQTLHLPRYHSSPTFHASFAWALLTPPPASTNLSPFSPSMLADLTRLFGDELGVQLGKRGAWEVTELQVKVGHHVQVVSL